MNKSKTSPDSAFKCDPISMLSVKGTTLADFVKALAGFKKESPLRVGVIHGYTPLIQERVQSEMLPSEMVVFLDAKEGLSILVRVKKP